MNQQCESEITDNYNFSHHKDRSKKDTIYCFDITT